MLSRQAYRYLLQDGLDALQTFLDRLFEALEAVVVLQSRTGLMRYHSKSLNWLRSQETAIIVTRNLG